MDAGGTVFDPAQTLPPQRLAQAEGLIELLRRLAATELRVVILPGAGTSYIRSLVTMIGNTAHERAVSLDGTLPADEEYAAAVGGSMPISIRAVLASGELDQLFSMAPIESVSRRMLLFVSRRDHYGRVEGAATTAELRSALDSLRGNYRKGLISVLRAILVSRLSARAVYWGQLLLSVASLCFIAYHQLRTFLTSRRSKKVPAAHIACSTSCGICLGTAQEDVDAIPEAENQRRWQAYRCGHMFHAECGDTWLQRSNVCPLCRRGNPKGSEPSKLYERARPMMQFLLLRTLLTLLPELLRSLDSRSMALETRLALEDD